jgi:hypothetical protein
MKNLQAQIWYKTFTKSAFSHTGSFSLFGKECCNPFAVLIYSGRAYVVSMQAEKNRMNNAGYTMQDKTKTAKVFKNLGRFLGLIFFRKILFTFPQL